MSARLARKSGEAVNAAIVGLGWWGLTIARELAHADGIRATVGIDPAPASRAAAAALGLAAADSLEAVLADAAIEAVIICSPHEFHARHIIQAAQAGRHVFCEKPLCTTRAELEAALEAVAAAGVVLGVGHERRFEPAVIDMRRRLASGELGTALLLEGNFSQDKFFALPKDNWRLQPAHAPVGPLSATGIHLVDLAVALLGTPTQVWARLATRGSDFANGDTLAITLGFESGATALLTAILATPFAGRLALYGSHGWMEIRDRTHPEHPTGSDVTRVLRGQPPDTHYAPATAAVRDNLLAFAGAVRGEAPYPVTLAEMTATVRTFEAITRSVATGQIETI